MDQAEGGLVELCKDAKPIVHPGNPCFFVWYHNPI